jgi:mRNA-degrading endonuclease toxin of MazEF toxin-antitoxin module
VGVSRLKLKPGDICLVEDDAVVIPETPDEKRTYHPKGRPCLVLSNDESCSRVTYPIVSIAPIAHSVHLKDEPDFLILPTKENGLDCESLIMLGHIQPVRKIDIFKIIGSLNEGEWELMLAHLLSNFDR